MHGRFSLIMLTSQACGSSVPVLETCARLIVLTLFKCCLGLISPNIMDASLDL